jgi:energy-coupling factor transporter ATP-binding protein EcfA2
MQAPLHIARITIRNILGIEELEFEPGSFVEISGENGAGKTSVLDAIKAVAGIGEDATLLRAGQEKGEIVLLLSDDSKIRKSVTRGGGGALTLDRAGVRQDKPASQIKAIWDALSGNPVDFLRAKPKDRVNVLLDSLPMQADEARLMEIMGRKIEIPEGPALTQIDTLHRQVFAERTETNRAIKQKTSTITQMAATLPSAEEGGDLDSPEELEAKAKAIEAARTAEFSRIATRLEEYRAERDGTISAKQDAIDTLQRQIEEKRADIAEARRVFSDLESRAAAARAAKSQGFDAQMVPINASIASIRQNVRAAAQAEVTRTTIRTMRDEADALEEDAAGQTKTLDALAAYKSELLDSLPISGLEVRDGEIYREGVVFDRLNKAQQVEIAVEIAKLRAGALGVICVDDLEMLDSGHFEAFRKQALDSGLQLFVTRVSDAPFAIHSDASQGEDA